MVGEWWLVTSPRHLFWHKEQVFSQLPKYLVKWKTQTWRDALIYITQLRNSWKLSALIQNDIILMCRVLQPLEVKFLLRQIQPEVKLQTRHWVMNLLTIVEEHFLIMKMTITNRLMLKKIGIKAWFSKIRISRSQEQPTLQRNTKAQL